MCEELAGLKSLQEHTFWFLSETPETVWNASFLIQLTAPVPFLNNMICEHSYSGLKYLEFFLLHYEKLMEHGILPNSCLNIATAMTLIARHLIFKIRADQSTLAYCMREASFDIIRHTVDKWQIRWHSLCLFSSRSGRILRSELSGTLWDLMWNVQTPYIRNVALSNTYNAWMSLH